MVKKLQHKVQVWIWTRGPGSSVKVLILKTQLDRGGFWQPVTGSVEKGETLSLAALREAREETSLKFVGRPRKLGRPFRFESRWGGLSEEQGYSIEAVGIRDFPVKLDSREHVDFSWVSASTARRKIEFDSNRKLLDELILSLTQLRGLRGTRTQSKTQIKSSTRKDS